MIALVRGVIRAATSSGSRFSVIGIDVGEDRRRTDARDRLGRRVEGERRADHLVAGADPERLEREDERVGPVRDADRMRYAEERRRLVLECLDLRPEDEAAGARTAEKRSSSSGMSGAYCAFTSMSGIGSVTRRV